MNIFDILYDLFVHLFIYLLLKVLLYARPVLDSGDTTMKNANSQTNNHAS